MTRTPDHTHLAALLACVQLGLRHEIAQHLAGQPRAQHFDGDKTTGGGGSDPTATALPVDVKWVTDPTTGRKTKVTTYTDRAAQDLVTHDKAMLAAWRALDQLAKLSDKYLPAHEPKRRQLIADTKGCALHERAGIEAHHPARCTPDFASVLDQPLRDPIPVCHACQDFVRRTVPARLPTNEELLRHERTGKWSVRTTGKRATVFTAQQIADEWNGAA